MANRCVEIFFTITVCCILLPGQEVTTQYPGRDSLWYYAQFIPQDGIRKQTASFVWAPQCAPKPLTAAKLAGSDPRAEVGLRFTGVNEDYIHKLLAERHTSLFVNKDDGIVLLEPNRSRLAHVDIHRGPGKEKHRHL